jgi:predicted GTPase
MTDVGRRATDSRSTGQIAEKLTELSRRLRAVEGASKGSLARRAERLAERVVTERFHIAVLGDFKRGKSTLINALLGQALLPSAVVPLTAVVTEVHIGAKHTAAVFKDGARRVIPIGEIDEFVTERGNPSNAKRIERVEVGVESEFGLDGLVLVDTPGLSSVNDGNSAEAHEALRDSDAAIVVLAADNPLSASELDLLAQLCERRAEVFVAINKVDHLTPVERRAVREFVIERAEAVLGRPVTPFCTSARRALELQFEGVGGDLEGVGELRKALVRFVTEDLVRVRRAATLAEFDRLAAEVNCILQLEEAAAAMDLGRLDVQSASLQRAVEDGRRLLADDVVVLGHGVERLVEEAGIALVRRAATAANSCAPDLGTTVASLPRNQLDRGVRAAVEALVRTHFETIRLEVECDVEKTWRTLIVRFAARVQGRIDALVEVASELFEVHLPQTLTPELSAKHGRFTYQFIYIEGQNAAVGHLVAHLLPGSMARRRAERRAGQLLAREFDKHAGRARYDMAERLSEAKSELVASMLSEFEQTQASLEVACTKARALRETGEEVQSARALVRDYIRDLITQIGQLLHPESALSWLLERKPDGQTGAGCGQTHQNADDHVPRGFEKSTVFDQSHGLERERGERGVGAAQSGAKQGFANVGEVVAERQTGEESQYE